MLYNAQMRSEYVPMSLTVLSSVVSMLIPVGLWLQGATIYDPHFLSLPLWPHVLRFGFLHSVGIFGLFLSLVAPLVLVTWPLRKLKRRAKSIVTEEAVHDLFIATCVEENFDCSMTGLVRSTPEMAWLVTVFSVGTLLSWGLVLL